MVWRGSRGSRTYACESSKPNCLLCSGGKASIPSRQRDNQVPEPSHSLLNSPLANLSLSPHPLGRFRMMSRRTTAYPVSLGVPLTQSWLPALPKASFSKKQQRKTNLSNRGWSPVATRVFPLDSEAWCRVFSFFLSPRFSCTLRNQARVGWV